jgi:hypothetical protein
MQIANWSSCPHIPLITILLSRHSQASKPFFAATGMIRPWTALTEHVKTSLLTKWNSISKYQGTLSRLVLPFMYLSDKEWYDISQNVGVSNIWIISNTTKWVIMNTILMCFEPTGNGESGLMGNTLVPNLQIFLKLRISTCHGRAPEARCTGLFTVCIIPPLFVRNNCLWSRFHTGLLSLNPPAFYQWTSVPR